VSFRQTRSPWVTQRCWRIKAVMISFDYHTAIPDQLFLILLRTGVFLNASLM
jgi:hypothetical protein